MTVLKLTILRLFQTTLSAEHKGPSVYIILYVYYTMVLEPEPNAEFSEYDKVMIYDSKRRAINQC